MADDLNAYLAEQLKDPEFAFHYRLAQLRSAAERLVETQRLTGAVRPPAPTDDEAREWYQRTLPGGMGRDWLQARPGCPLAALAAFLWLDGTLTPEQARYRGRGAS